MEKKQKLIFEVEKGATSCEYCIIREELCAARGFSCYCAAYDFSTLKLIEEA